MYNKVIQLYMCMCTQSCSILCDPVTVACQALLSMEFSRQEYWRGLPFITPGDIPDPGIKLVSLSSPALAGRYFTTNTMWDDSLAYVP